MSSITYSNKNSFSVFGKLLIAIFAGILVSFGLILAFGIGLQIKNANHIIPGVAIAGIDLSNLSPQEAAEKLQQQIAYPDQGRILLRDGEKTYLLTPVQLGLFFDPETTTTQAMKIGRDGGISKRINTQWNSWRYGRHHN